MTIKEVKKKMSEKRLHEIEIRKIDGEDSEGMVLEGRAVIFNSPETYWGETELIDEHSLDETDMSDVVLRYNHNDTQYTLARTRNKSLELELREDGLYFKASLIPTTTNKDAYLMVKEGLLDKCSFSFSLKEAKYDEETRTRTITKISKLYDVALVDFPFYNDTVVEAKSLDNRKEFVEQVKKERRAKMLYELRKDELLKRL